MNFLAILVAALSSFVVGFVYYHPKVLGTIWMKSASLSEEDLKKGNMAKIFGFSFIFAFLLAASMYFLTVHQMGIYGLLEGVEEGSEAHTALLSVMETHKNSFRTFQHGALHGIMMSIFTALPVIGIGAMYERKSWKYILVHLGYWILTFALMGGIICGWQ